MERAPSLCGLQGMGALAVTAAAQMAMLSNIFTIAVGSVDQTGQRAFYDEECPAKMVVVFHYNRPLRTTAGLRTQAVSR